MLKLESLARLPKVGQASSDRTKQRTSHHGKNPALSANVAMQDTTGHQIPRCTKGKKIMGEKTKAKISPYSKPQFWRDTMVKTREKIKIFNDESRHDARSRTSPEERNALARVFFTCRKQKKKNRGTW
jgi:hypothetical protein